MNIQQIRNATIIVEFAGIKFLIDPYLAEKGTYPPIPNSVRQDQNNPLVELPISIDKIIEGIDAVIVTHTHPDHWDEKAVEVLPKNLKIFVQNEKDATRIQDAGFNNIEILQEDTVFEGISLVKTKGEHGRGEILKLAGDVCGVVFKHNKEKTLYVAGDTVWYKGVQEVIRTHKPEVIVVNAGANQFHEGGLLVMGKEDVYEVSKAAPDAKIICVHMEAVNHWTLSREELKGFASEQGISSNVLVPDDGTAYRF
ncbi:MBL fold metallo-hydrolase [Litchfieldia salsa]|uniref:L-ascorbate metabolism protein UlaG, beta-lactamase superfamily n=1 Tax=Litchfieldia salsa TaxID=930152 RepID=A0A1H0W812_9BACI|nr:MBL fold metallo-hydrolase [Litchfieldia salsa]SDP86621.1 L-ascorbate metabolism protein UlaG, beta-lactamase superfamily [Litchfieldia salsa]